MSETEQIERMLQEAQSMPYGESRLAVEKQAMDLADRYQLEALSFDARLAYCKTAGEYSLYSRTLPHFPKLLNYADEHPGAAKPTTLFYLYTVAVFALLDFPQVSKNDLQTALLDLEGRMRKFGIDELRILQDMLIAQFLLGNDETAARYFAEIEDDFVFPTELGTSRMEEFRYGLIYSAGFYLLYIREWDKALRILAPLEAIYSGANSYPDLSRSLTLIPWLVKGETHRVLEHLERTIRDVPDEPGSLAMFGDLMAALALTQNYAKGVGLLEQSIKHLMVREKGISYLVWLRGVEHLLKRIPASEPQVLKLRIPKEHPLFRSDEAYAISDLHQHFAQERSALIEALTQRNQSDSFARYHQYWDQMADQVG
jgi:hypothetical protein